MSSRVRVIHLFEPRRRPASRTRLWKARFRAAAVLWAVVSMLLAPGGMLRAQDGVWNTNGGGNWSDTSKWLNGIIANGAGAIADFDTIDISANGTVVVDGDFTVGQFLAGDNNRDWIFDGIGTLTLDQGDDSSPIINISSPDVFGDIVTIAGAVAGNDGFTKTGVGLFRLHGDHSTSLFGQIIVQQGVLDIKADNNLGSAANGVTLDGGRLSINGTGTLSTARTFTLGAAGGIFDVDANDVLATSGNITGAGNFQLLNTGTMAIAAATDFTGAATLGDNRTTDGGLLRLEQAGTLSGVASIAVDQFFSLIVDDSATALADRINNSADITLRGGTLSYLGNASGSSETLGDLLLQRGASNISLTPGAGGLNLTVGSLARSAGATVDFNGAFGGNSQLTGDAGTWTNTNGILGGFATVNEADFATVGAGGIDAFSGYATDINTAAATDNVRLGASAILNSNAERNSLILDDGVNLQLGPSGNRHLNLTSGGLLKTGTGDSSITSAGGSGSLTAGGTASAELFATVGSGAGSLSLDTILRDNDGGGSVALVKSGEGTLLVAGDSANTYSGATVINEGTLIVAKSGALGSAAGGTKIGNGATLAFQGGFDYGEQLEAVQVEGIGAGGAGAIRNLGGTNVFGGTIENLNATTLQAESGRLILTGPINSAVAYNVNIAAGAGVIEFAASNDFRGAALVDSGATLAISANGALGISSTSSANRTAISSGGTLQLDGGFTYTQGKRIDLAGNGVGGVGALFNATGDNVLDNSQLLLTANTRFGVAAGTTLTIDTEINQSSGSRQLTLRGGGTLVLNSANTYAGATHIDEGTLVVGADALLNTTGALGNSSAAVTLGNGDMSGSLLTGGAFEIARDITVNSGSGGRVIGGATADASLYSGNISLDADVALTAARRGAVTFTGILSGSGSVVKTGSGSVVLTGPNRYTGSTSVLAGTLVVSNNVQFRADGPLGNSDSPIVLGDTSGDLDATLTSSTGVLFDREILVQAGSSGRKILAGADGTVYQRNITLNDDLFVSADSGETVTFSGGVGLGSTNGVTKVGEGTVRFTGNNNYTGLTKIEAGTLVGIAGNTPFGGAGDMELAGGGLRLEGVLSEQATATTGDLMVSGGGRVTVDASAGGSTRLVFDELRRQGRGTVTFVPSGGSATMNASEIFSFGNLAALERNGMLDAWAVVETSEANFLAHDGAGNLHVTTAYRTGDDINRASNATIFQADGSSLNVLTGNASVYALKNDRQNIGGAFTLTVGNDALANPVAGVILNGGASISTAELAFGGSEAVIHVHGSEGVIHSRISGTAGLTKFGSGSLLLSGAGGPHVYTGGTNINGGTLRLGADSVLPDGGDVFVAVGATLDLGGFRQNMGLLTGQGSVLLGTADLIQDVAAGQTSQFDGVLSGGRLIKNGEGTLVLTGNNLHSGNDINAGALSFDEAANLGVPTADIALNGGTLRYTGLVDDTLDPLDPDVSRAISTTSATSAIEVVNNVTLAIGSDITGTGGLVKRGAGTLRLDAVSTFTGPIAIEEGTLRYGVDFATARVDYTIASGATLDFGDNDAFIGNVDSTGTILGNGGAIDVDGGVISGRIVHLRNTFDKNTSATLALSGQNHWGGVDSSTQIRVMGGTILFENANAFGLGPTEQTMRVRIGNTGGTDIVAFGAGASGLAVYSQLLVNGTAGTKILTVDADGMDWRGDGNLQIDFRIDVSGNNTFTYSGDMRETNVDGGNAWGLTKVGSGTLVLAGTTTYTGDTTVNAGRLEVNGSVGGNVVINSDSTLAGVGEVLGSITLNSGGTLAPGNSPGRLSAGSSSWEGNSTFELSMNNAAGIAGPDLMAAQTGWSLLAVGGTLDITNITLSTPLTIDLVSLDPLSGLAGDAANFNLAQNYSWDFVSFDTLVGTFDPAAFLIDTTLFSNAFDGDFAVVNTGGSLAVQYNTAVPEPGSMALAALAALAMGGYGWRRQKRKNAVAPVHLTALADPNSSLL